MKKQELIAVIIRDLTTALIVNNDKPTVEQVAEAVANPVEDFVSSIEKQLMDLIKDWEEKMSDDDRTLYSLGLRRALDVVRGESPIPS
jgi:gas vesicle protein